MAYIARYGRYTPKEAVERGRHKMHTPYVWGTWDCSAFVSYCYFEGRRWTTATMASLSDSELRSYGFRRLPVGNYKHGDIVYRDNGVPDESHTGIITTDNGICLLQNGGGGNGVWQHPGAGGPWSAILRPTGITIVRWDKFV